MKAKGLHDLNPSHIPWQHTLPLEPRRKTSFNMSVAVTEYGTHNQGLFTLSPPQTDWEERFGAPNLE